MIPYKMAEATKSEHLAIILSFITNNFLNHEEHCLGFDSSKLCTHSTIYTIKEKLIVIKKI